MNKNRGITLIALVVTIIILLILSSVSITTIFGENGIITKTRLAKNLSEASNEKEAIQLDVMLANMEKNLNEINKFYIGTPLYDKTLENGNKWSIIVENNSQKIYGTGWNFIEQGTEIENYGKTQYDWLVNYSNGEIKQLEKNTYTKLMYGSNLAVKDGIILNIDPINMADSTSWGNNAKLYGIEEGDGYGWNETEIKFDGVDDYLEIYNSFEIEKGITFEFYAKKDGDIQGEIPILSKSLPYMEYSGMRLLIADNQIQFCMNMTDAKSDWSPGNNMKHWILKKLNQDFKNDDGGYITLVVNTEKSNVSLYEKGDLIGTTVVSQNWLSPYILKNEKVPFLIGKRYGYEENEVITIYGKINIYACRLYNKVLTDEEIKANYNQTVAYHNMITNK